MRGCIIVKLYRWLTICAKCVYYKGAINLIIYYERPFTSVIGAFSHYIAFVIEVACGFIAKISGDAFFIFLLLCWVSSWGTLLFWSPSQMPKLYAKCPFLFIFLRFMQYFSSILHNILLFEWWFLCLLVGSKTETLPKYYQFSQKIGYPRHIETIVFTRGK